MKWRPEAEKAIRKVPFFVRKRVRVRVETEAIEAGRKMIALADVKATQKRFLAGMSSEIKGYQVDTCFGSNGCPNRIQTGHRLMEAVESVLKKEDLLDFLKQHVKGDLKFHHEFRVTFADCPNACSQPQIKDIGIISACMPSITEENCTRCLACVDVCKEDAIALYESKEVPDIFFNRCLKCGQCISECPTGTIAAGERGFRVLMGGKLGRHPKLARELIGIFSEKEVLNIVKACIDFYKKNSRNGERFAEIFQDRDFDEMNKKFGKYSLP